MQQCVQRDLCTLCLTVQGLVGATGQLVILNVMQKQEMETNSNWKLMFQWEYKTVICAHRAAVLQ